MANIKVNDIKPAGTELFLDSESFMNDVSNDEIDHVLGGLDDDNMLPNRTLSNASLAFCNPGTESTASWFACLHLQDGVGSIIAANQVAI